MVDQEKTNRTTTIREALVEAGASSQNMDTDTLAEHIANALTAPHDDEHHDDEHKADEHKADEHEADASTSHDDEHKADEHKADA